MELSLLKRKEDLDPSTTRHLDSAIDYLTNSAEFQEDQSTWSTVLKAYASVKGMAAKEIIVTAWNRQVWTVEEEIKSLGALRVAHLENQDMLARLILDDVRLYKPSSGFLEVPVVEALVSNHTGRVVTGMQLRASLVRTVTPGNPQLVADEWIVQRVYGPFVDDSQVRLRVECHDTTWRSMLESCDDCSFHFEVVAMLGEGSTTIASTEFGKFEEVRLAAMLDNLEGLQTTGPPLGCLGD